MRKINWLVFASSVFSLILAVGIGSAFCARTGPDDGVGDFAMYVSPSTIIKSAPCNWVTIHTEIPINSVEGVNVTVDAIEIEDAKIGMDSRGNLVVKLHFEDVISIVKPPESVITLTVLAAGGEELEANVVVPVNE